MRPLQAALGHFWWTLRIEAERTRSHCGGVFSQALSTTKVKGHTMRKRFAVLGLIALLAGGMVVADDLKDDQARLENAGKVLTEILDVPEGVPHDLLDKAECVLVFPSVIKGAFIVGGQYGRGAMVCRTKNNFSGPWGPPAMYALEGASVGFQLGGEATDFVLMVMNPRGAEELLTSKVKLGADASAAAGPKGRDATAATDATLRAEILSYSRTRGAFAGVSLEGSTLRPDDDASRRIYGRPISARDIVLNDKIPVPPAARTLVSRLRTASPHDQSESEHSAAVNK